MHDNAERPSSHTREDVIHAAMIRGGLCAARGLSESQACHPPGCDPTPSRRVLDPCCGGRMMWFDRQHPDAVFGDQRSEVITVTDNSRGNASGQRTIRIEPDTLMDFRALPYPDRTFRLVAFDPPHLRTAGPRSWLAAKYGKLSEDWREDLRRGFAECFRVLDDDGVLVFKWSEVQVKMAEVLALAPHAPLFGNTSGKRMGTHWLVFMKPQKSLLLAGSNAGFAQAPTRAPALGYFLPESPDTEGGEA